MHFPQVREWNAVAFRKLQEFRTKSNNHRRAGKKTNLQHFEKIRAKASTRNIQDQKIAVTIAKTIGRKITESFLHGASVQRTTANDMHALVFTLIILCICLWPGSSKWSRSTHIVHK